MFSEAMQAGLVVGFTGGMLLAGRVISEKPPARRVAAVLAAAVAIVVALAAPLKRVRRCQRRSCQGQRRRGAHGADVRHRRGSIQGGEDQRAGTRQACRSHRRRVAVHPGAAGVTRQRSRRALADGREGLRVSEAASGQLAASRTRLARRPGADASGGGRRRTFRIGRSGHRHDTDPAVVSLSDQHQHDHRERQTGQGDGQQGLVLSSLVVRQSKLDDVRPERLLEIRVDRPGNDWLHRLGPGFNWRQEPIARALAPSERRANPRRYPRARREPA